MSKGKDKPVDLWQGRPSDMCVRKEGDPEPRKASPVVPIDFKLISPKITAYLNGRAVELNSSQVTAEEFLKAAKWHDKNTEIIENWCARDADGKLDPSLGMDQSLYFGQDVIAIRPDACYITQPKGAKLPEHLRLDLKKAGWMK